MTIGEIIEALKKEFPNEYKSFTIDISVHSTNTQVEISLYTKTKGFVHGTSFEDCLNRFKVLHPKEVPLDQEVPTLEK